MRKLLYWLHSRSGPPHVNTPRRSSTSTSLKSFRTSNLASSSFFNRETLQKSPENCNTTSCRSSSSINVTNQNILKCLRWLEPQSRPRRPMLSPHQQAIDIVTSNALPNLRLSFFLEAITVQCRTSRGPRWIPTSRVGW